MTNKHLAFIVAAVVFVGVAGIGVWTHNSSKESSQEVASDAYSRSQIETTHTGGDQGSSVSQGQVASENIIQNQTTSSEVKNCPQSFSQDTLTNAKLDIKNKNVELTIRGFGVISIALYDRDAPKTVENFLRLVNSGYYNCITFHRVAKGFVIQSGDPTGTGTGGISAYGGDFADELNPESQSYKEGYKKGILAMANRGPNTNTSQFFILLGDVPLEHKYTIFGKVTAGLDVVETIGKVDITPRSPADPNDGKPVVPVVLEKITIK